MKLLSVCIFAAALACVFGNKYTVTEEAWFEVKVEDMDGPGQDFQGRFTIALFGDTAPMTVLNFVSITKGWSRGDDTLTYKDSAIHRIVPDFVIQMGDVTRGNGTGGSSIYGKRFNDEEFILSHRSPGWVAMANHGPDTNNSQFYILLTKARWLDGKHVVFGKVISGMSVIETLGEVPSDDRTALPEKKVTVVDCGINFLKAKYELSEAQLDSTEDL